MSEPKTPEQRHRDKIQRFADHMGDTYVAGWLKEYEATVRDLEQRLGEAEGLLERVIRDLFYDGASTYRYRIAIVNHVRAFLDGAPEGAEEPD